MNSPYVYVLDIPGQPLAVFTWPNVARKFIRTAYTSGGELHLPPEGHVALHRHKVNPAVGRAIVVTPLNIRQFMAAK